MSSKVHFIVFAVYLFLSYARADNDGDSSAYSTKYDNINLQDLLKNDRLRKNYVNCLLNEGPCTPDGQELKNSLPDAVETDCSKCSGKQKDGSMTVTHYLIDNHPEEWDRLEKIYDKNGEYKKRYLASKQTSGEKKEDATTTSAA